jgi:hypothetical protein
MAETRFEQEFRRSQERAAWMRRWAARFVVLGSISFMLSIGVFACGLTSVAPDAGQEAVLTRKPILFGSGGVDPVPVKTGRKYVMWTTTATYIDVTPQQFAVHFDDLMSRDGVPLDFDAVIRLRITDSARLVQNFGAGWYKTNVESEFRNRVRQAVRKHGMNETAINATAIDDIDKEVSTSMEAYVQTSKLPVSLIDITVGRANPPDSVKHQRVETAAQEQRINTEKQRQLAEEARMTAERTRATADNAYREGMQLSPLQFLELERIKMLQAACGKGNCTFLIGQEATPILQVK